jgi:hypothetical protein
MVRHGGNDSVEPAASVLKVQGEIKTKRAGYSETLVPINKFTCYRVPEASTSMRRLTTFRSTTDRIYDGGPIRI